MKEEILYREKSKVLGKHLGIGRSIVSGSENPVGLKMVFYTLESGESASFFTPENLHEGHEGVFHGGLISSVLDEVMGRAARRSFGSNDDGCYTVFTGELTVKYLKPILTGYKKYVFAKSVKIDGRKNYTEGYIVDENNVVYAKSTGIYVSVMLDSIDEPTFKAGKMYELNENDPKEL